MDENKNLEGETEEIKDAAESGAQNVDQNAQNGSGTVESFVENGTEAVQEAADQAAEKVESGLFGSTTQDTLMGEKDTIVEGAKKTDNTGLFGEKAQDTLVETGEKAKKKAPVAIIIGAVVIILVLVIAVLCKQYSGKIFNKYNRQGYVNTSGKTISEVADKMGMSVEDFLKKYDLPEDMPGNTEETAAYYTMPTSKIAEQYGTDFDTLKKELELGDDITPETKWGDAEATIKVGTYVGAENLGRFKEYYGLGDNVTADTKWGEIRNQVDQKNKEENEAQKKAAEEAAKATPAAADAASADASAAPADGAAAPAADGAAPADGAAAPAADAAAAPAAQQ